jgi:hypothetical protein
VKIASALEKRFLTLDAFGPEHEFAYLDIKIKNQAATITYLVSFVWRLK